MSSTQYFHDGNKRTAWLVTVTFLKENGYRFPQVDDVEAEAFVLTVAKDLCSNPDEPDRTVEMAAEWLRLRWHGSPSGGTARQAWAVLAIRAQSTENDGVYDVEQLGLATLATPSVPAVFRVALFARIFYGPEDVGGSHHLDVAVEHQRFPFVQLGHREFRIDLTPPVASGHPHHVHGILPTYVSGTLLLDIQGEGTTRLVVSLDGKLLVKVPLTIKVVPDLYVDDDDVPDWLLVPRPK